MARPVKQVYGGGTAFQRDLDPREEKNRSFSIIFARNVKQLFVKESELNGLKTWPGAMDSVLKTYGKACKASLWRKNRITERFGSSRREKKSSLSIKVARNLIQFIVKVNDLNGPKTWPGVMDSVLIIYGKAWAASLFRSNRVSESYGSSRREKACFF